MATKSGDINPDAYKKALAAADNLLKKQASLNKSTETLNAAWAGISSSIFGISGADWFTEVPKTTEEIQKQMQMVDKMNIQIKSLGSELNETLKGAITKVFKEDGEVALEKFGKSFADKSAIIKSSMGGVFNNVKIDVEDVGKIYELINAEVARGGSVATMNSRELNNLAKTHSITQLELESIESQILTSREDSVKSYKELLGYVRELDGFKDEELKREYLIALAEEDIASFIDKRGEKAQEIIRAHGEMNTLLGKEAIQYSAMVGSAEEYNKELSKTTKTQLDIAKGFEKIAQNIAKSVLQRILEFDTSLHSAQRNFGIQMDANIVKLSVLTQRTAEFGMSIEDTMLFMGGLGAELNTTNFDVLAQAADDLKAVQMATGISADNLSKITGELMRGGRSSKQVAEAMGNANAYAKLFGVNTKKVLEGVAANIDKMRTMGFVGGVESLTRMVAESERLRMNIDEVFDMSKRARGIEGAIEMAAELQLAGGSFANVNPMDLLSAARQGPEELNKILTSMGGDVGHWVANMDGSEEYKFDPVDVDRLQIMADATGISLDSMTKMIQKKAEDAKKVEILPDLTFEGMKGPDGKIMDPASVQDMFTESIDLEGNIIPGSLLDRQGVTDLSKLTQEQANALMKDEIAKQKNLETQAKENMEFKKALTAFTASLLNLFTMFQPVFEFLGKAIMKITEFFDAAPIAKWTVAIVGLTAALGLFTLKAVGSIAGSVGKLGGLMGKGGGAVTQAVTKTAPGPAIPSVKGAKGGKTLGKSLVSFARELQKIGNMKIKLKGILNFAAAIALLLIPLAGVALIFGLLGGDPLILLALGAALVGMAYAMQIMGKAKVDIENIAMMALAMLIIGVALVPFAFAAKIMTDVNWLSVLAGIGILMLVVVLMGLIGSIVSGPVGALILTGALVLLAVAGILLLAAVAFVGMAIAFTMLTKVEWSKLAAAGPALMSFLPAVAAFALAGLMFTNPLVMIGMMLMLGVLVAMSLVLIPLSLALVGGATALEGMANSVEKLNDSLGKLDFDKLEDLKEISQGFATASANGGGKLASALEKLADSIGGGGKSGKGGGGTKTLIVQLKMPNGRVLEEHIIDDIDKAT